MMWEVYDALGAQGRGIWPSTGAAVEGNWGSLEAAVLELKSKAWLKGRRRKKRAGGEGEKEGGREERPIQSSSGS